MVGLKGTEIIDLVTTGEGLHAGSVGSTNHALKLSQLSSESQVIHSSYLLLLSSSSILVLSLYLAEKIVLQSQMSGGAN